ncbi:MAG: hypothetical protein DRJ09_08720 [Bacteroidetes bacterium]|nr:MAG: hypothetical protein DRJ09_08720 [Bacteroidota bacterium]
MNKNNNKRPHYLNPYFGGVLLGLLVIATFYITGRGLGASGAVKSTVVETVETLAPQHAESSPYYSKYIPKDTSPMNNWLVFESFGVLLGGLLSGVIYGRVKKFRVEHGAHTTSAKRLVFAVLGGVLFGFGSQFGRGCTSGAALVGSASFSFGGVIVLISIFGTGYAVAYFFRKLWI